MSLSVRGGRRGRVTAWAGLGFPPHRSSDAAVPTGAGQRPPAVSPEVEQEAGAGGNAHLGAG